MIQQAAAHRLVTLVTQGMAGCGAHASRPQQLASAELSTEHRGLLVLPYTRPVLGERSSLGSAPRPTTTTRSQVYLGLLKSAGAAASFSTDFLGPGTRPQT
jgi:hypothetical protein